MRFVVAGLLMGLMLIGHPAAASDEQTFVDRCTAALAPTAERDLLAPWLDICGGDVTVTAADTVAIEVELTFAGDVTQRTDSHYQAHWTVGDCRSSIVWADGFGGVRQGPLVVARNTGGWLDLTCGDTSQRFDLAADTLTFEGTAVRWSIPLQGDLAPLAELYQSGTVLTELRADAGPDTVLMGHSNGSGICLDDDCWQYLADNAGGTDVVVE